jgi:hypothetical protein
MDWTENVIIADADYVDRVAFNLTVNFERMIGRRIPQADMARWVECIALDGGMRPPASHLTPPTSHLSTQVVLVHDTERGRMENFTPGCFADELDGKAFAGNLGEFTFVCPSPEGMTTKENLFLDTLQLVVQAEGVKRLMVVPSEEHLNSVRQLLRRFDDDSRRTTVFTMQPLTGSIPFRQEILGYSLMAALGVKGNELNPEN